MNIDDQHWLDVDVFTGNFCLAFLQWKTKLEALLNFVLKFIHKKGYKNIDYRKLVTSLYNGFLKPVVYCRKNRCKKVSPY